MSAWCLYFYWFNRVPVRMNVFFFIIPLMVYRRFRHINWIITLYPVRFAYIHRAFLIQISQWTYTFRKTMWSNKIYIITCSCGVYYSRTNFFLMYLETGHSKIVRNKKKNHYSQFHLYCNVLYYKRVTY